MLLTYCLFGFRTPYDRIPRIAGSEVDLYHLYRRVIGLGGWQKVNYQFITISVLLIINTGLKLFAKGTILWI